MLHAHAHCSESSEASSYSPQRVSPFSVSGEMAQRLPQLGQMTEQQLVAQLTARAYVVLVMETGRTGDRKWSARLGLHREYSAQYRHTLLWSEEDQALRIVVYSMAFSAAEMVLAEGVPEFEYYRPLITEQAVQLAKMQARAHLRHEAPPPYEVLVSWLTHSGRPLRRILKLSSVVGLEQAQTPFGHDDRLAARAMQIVGEGLDVRVTVRSQRSPAQIAVEFCVDELQSCGHLRVPESNAAA